MLVHYNILIASIIYSMNLKNNILLVIVTRMRILHTRTAEKNMTQSHKRKDCSC